MFSFSVRSGLRVGDDRDHRQLPSTRHEALPFAGMPVRELPNDVAESIDALR
jgi:hypothetical protein